MLLTHLTIPGRPEFSLDFKTNLLLVYGDSGTGKSYLFSCLQNFAVLHPEHKIVCLNYNNIDIVEKVIRDAVEQEAHKVFIIDNADIVLNIPELKWLINRDTHNQYVLLGHSPKGYILAQNAVAALEIKEQKGRLVYLMERFKR